MLNTIFKRLFAITLFISFATFNRNAEAFRLAPCLRILTYENGALGAEAIRSQNLCPLAPEHLKTAVHEQITRFSIAEYQGKSFWLSNDKSNQINSTRFNYMSSPSWTSEKGGTHLTSALIFGTWWNDEPLMLLWGQGKDITNGILKVRSFFETDRATYAGGIAHCSVDAAEHLTRSSHFGNLQHLHFMSQLPKGSTAEARLKETLDQTMVWMEFAYNIAIGKLSPTS